MTPTTDDKDVTPTTDDKDVAPTTDAEAGKSKAHETAALDDSEEGGDQYVDQSFDET